MIKMPQLPFFRKKPSFERRHVRHNCCIVAELTIIDRSITLPGVVLEVSMGGVLFRPASSFILDRRGEAVSVQFENLKRAGTIMNVRPVGYGIRLFQDIEEEALDDLVGNFGIDKMQMTA